MSNIAVYQPRGVTVEMAQRFAMDPRRFEQVLRATVVPRETTAEEFAAFLIVCRNYKLNPITREIYAMRKKGGGIQAVVGVDGWSNLINSHPAADGMEFRDQLDERGNLVSITCRIYRKDRAHPIEATEYLSECIRKDKDGKVVDVWAQWPRRMLRHKAMIQAARYAFGFAGVVDPDEMDRFTREPHQPDALRDTMALTAEEAVHQPVDTLLDDARAEARRGTDAFRAWLEERSTEERLRLSAADEDFEAMAAQADAERGEAEGVS